MECPAKNDKEPAYYGTYLAVKDLLDLQKGLDLKEGKLHAHDEMLFIIIHQTYELWFKQILFELDTCCEVLKREVDDNDPDMNVLVHRLKRVVEIWKVLNHQVDVLETMTPLDFLDFRSFLDGASGFQSLQFRQIEATLGLRTEDRYHGEYYRHTATGGFCPAEQGLLIEADKETSLLQLVGQWLARTPFIEDAAYWTGWDAHLAKTDADTPAETLARPPFWVRYRVLYEQSLSPRDKKQELLSAFDNMFFEDGANGFKAPSLRAALFIMLYRDEPLFRLPFELLNALLEIDEQLANFRYRHLQMVRRMIGTRVGTGGSSGEKYLQGAVTENYVYKALAGIITFLIERGNRPTLPQRLLDELRFKPLKKPAP